MTIGIEAQRIFRKNKHGMDFVALELIKALQKKDLINNYIIFVRPDEDDKCLNETENFKIVKVKGFSYPSWEQIALPLAVKKEKLDILHCTSNTAPYFINVPIILTLHDIIYLEDMKNEGTLYQRFGNYYRRFLVPKIIKKVSSVITVSNYEKFEILKKLNHKNLKVVYNGVSDHFKPIYDVTKLRKIKKTYSLPDDFILFLGNTAHKKNLKNVIKAFSDFKKKDENNISLVITDYKRLNLIKCLRKINNISIYKDIVLPGYISNQDLPYIFNLSKLFLYPSLRESFGIPILEALACGVPVITSNTSSMPEIAGDACYLVDPKKPKNISKAISKRISELTVFQSNVGNENKKRYLSKLALKGIERASNFSWEESAKKVLNIYKDIYNERKGGK